MKTAPQYAGNSNLPGKIISLRQDVIMHEMSGGLHLLPLIHGVPPKDTPRPHDITPLQMRIVKMIFLLFLFQKGRAYHFI
jgi:hypothetical protein